MTHQLVRQQQVVMVTAVVMTSYRFGGAVVNERVLHGQRHVGGACGDGAVRALTPGLQEAVGKDCQQSQDGHRQDDGQRDGA